MPRTLPSSALALPEALLLSTPRVGLFWTAGNPGAVATDVQDSFSLYAVGGGGEQGEYRRPLDPEESAERHGAALAWRPFGERGASIGSVRVTSSELRGAMSDYDLAYPGSPYVVMDTAASDLGRTEVQLEGAGGWQVGRLGFGLALGYRAHHTRTVEAPVPRSLSVADPGASVGVTWKLSPALTLGMHGRWRSHAERVTLYSVAAPSRVYRLQGYFEPPPQDLAGGFYSRRLEREGYAGAVSAGGTAAGATWSAFVERGTQEERQFPAQDVTPDVDTWRSDAITFGAAMVRPFDPRNGQLSLTARYIKLSGEAGRGDIPDTVTFVGDESVFHGEGELRYDASKGAQLVGVFVVRHEDRARSDQLAHVASTVRSWTTGFGVAAVFQPGTRLQVSPAVATTWYGAGGAIPDPLKLGGAFGRYVAPEMAVNVSDAGEMAAGVTVQWSIRNGTGVWGRVRYLSLSPSGEAITLPFQPEGTRTRWTLEVGMTVG
ncbi:MAG: DUF6850 family outer membrane beta-barrel protein [Longimicrobiales bacterium]